MICPVCNNNIPDGSNYCPSCAADLTKHRGRTLAAQQQQAKRVQPDPRMAQQGAGQYPPVQDPRMTQQYSGQFPPVQDPRMTQQYSGQFPPVQDPRMAQQYSGQFPPVQDPRMAQQYPGQYPPAQDPRIPPQGGQFQPAPQYGGGAGGGEGGVFEGITTRGKLLFGVGGLALLGVLVLLVNNLFGGGNGDPNQLLPASTEAATFAPFFDVFDTPEPEDDPFDFSSLAVAATPAPTAMPVLTSLLKKGSKGEEVILVQERLQLLGFLPADERVDGEYGPATVNAVKEFQKQIKKQKKLGQDFYTDGSVGPATWVELFSYPIDLDDGTQNQQQNDDHPVNQPG